MSKSKKQLKKDLKYLKKHLDDNKEINQIIEHTKKNWDFITIFL